MEEYSPPKHSRETMRFDEYSDILEDVPRWKARRLAIAMDHSDKIETKIIED